MTLSLRFCGTLWVRSGPISAESEIVFYLALNYGKIDGPAPGIAGIDRVPEGLKKGTGMRLLTKYELDLIAGGQLTGSTDGTGGGGTDPGSSPTPSPSPTSPPPPPPPTGSVVEVGDAQWNSAVDQVTHFLDELDGSYDQYQHGGGDQNSNYDDHSDSGPLPEGMLELFGWMPHIQDMDGYHFYDYLTQDMDAELLDYQSMAIQYSGGAVSMKANDGPSNYTFDFNGTLITIEKHQGTGVPSTPDEIVVNGVTWEVHSVEYNYAGSNYIMASYGGGTPTSSSDQFTTPGGIVIKTAAHLDANQQATMAKIVDYGYTHGKSGDDIAIAVKMAFQESSFRNSSSNGSHYGLYEFDQATWERYGGTGSVNGSSVDAQIAVFFAELGNLHDRYSAAYSPTLTGDTASAVPRDISFENYAKVKHEGGPNDYSFHGATEQGYWSAYQQSGANLGALIYYPRTT